MFYSSYLWWWLVSPGRWFKSLHSLNSPFSKHQNLLLFDRSPQRQTTRDSLSVGPRLMIVPLSAFLSKRCANHDIYLLGMRSVATDILSLPEKSLGFFSIMWLGRIRSKSTRGSNKVLAGSKIRKKMVARCGIRDAGCEMRDARCGMK